MKKIILFLCWCFAIQFANSQKFALKHNAIYPSVDNVIECTVEGYANSAIFLSSDGGSIKKKDDRFIFWPSKKGEASIWIKVKEGKLLKEVGQRKILVQEFPKPLAMFTGWQHTTRNSFLAMGGVRAVFDAELTGNVVVENYTIVAMRDSSFLFSYKNTGVVWEPALSQKLVTLAQGDCIIAYNIQCMLPDSTQTTTQPISFTL